MNRFTPSIYPIFIYFMLFATILNSCVDDDVAVSRTSAQRCNVTSDCDLNQKCLEGFCLADRCQDGSCCQVDDDCSEGQRCDLETLQCYESQCTQNSDCNAGYLCETGRCLIDVDADRDRDGVPDEVDLCPDSVDPEQDDLDQDAIGDVCDDDVDGDGVVNTMDNCPSVPNENQENTDNEGEGDACDGDQDGDTIKDENDNCPFLQNINQSDLDQDLIGDICDDDLDGDGIENDMDNCPSIPNSDQRNSNNDRRGDACAPELLLRCGECGVESVSGNTVTCVTSRCNDDILQTCEQGTWSDGFSCSMLNTGCVNFAGFASCQPPRSSFFTCADQVTEIPRSLVCDGIYHCPDQSDETRAGQTMCSPLSCQIGPQIYQIFQCDGSQDCVDGSDEADCEIASFEP